MVQITRQEKDYLIEHGYLKSKQGQYSELYVASRRRKGKRKRYYICETLVQHLPKVEDDIHINKK